MNSRAKFTFEDCELIAPVTALEFGQSTKVFVGEGPYLKIYETTCGQLVKKERVFDNQCLHLIKLYDSDCGSKVVVCGGRAVSILNVQNKELVSEIQAIGRISFNDWIWDVCLLQGTSETESCVAVITGHNAVWLWNFKEDRKWMASQCKEQCILYCARFIGGKTLDSMWLACGTVFNEVLLWKVTDSNVSEDKVPVRNRLTGHDGVIFSIRYNQGRQLLCSVSDDRSIRVWRMVFHEHFLDVTVSADPLLTLYGHKARVWDCLILKQCIISIGEDSMCLQWNSEGQIIQSWKGHIGKSIWSLACDSDENLIATGGGDGAVRIWPVENEIEDKKEEKHFCSTIPCQRNITQQTREETPRMIGLLRNSSVLVMTDKGNLHSFCWFEDERNATGEWGLIRNEPDFSSYSIMALTDCRTIIALGNISGTIKLISFTDPSWLPLTTKPYSEKVLSLHWLRSVHDSHFSLFSCGPEGLVIWWIVECLSSSKTFSCKVKANFRLPYCRQRWPNSVFLYGRNAACSELDKCLVLCGDRRGSLHVFKPTAKDELPDPVQSLIGIHGRNGVTSICCNSGYIYTTGRDGYIRQYKLYSENLELLDKKKVYKGMEWIDQVNFTSEGEVLVLGFHTVDFIIWNMTRNEVLFRVPCGGGHRNWDILHTTKDHGTKTIFTYLKQSTVHVHSCLEIKKQCTSTIQNSFHGRETNCVCFIGCFERRNEETQIRLLATGSEDTTINVMIYNPTEINGRRCRKVVTCEGHISSVRCLASIKVPPGTLNKTHSQQYLLFSGGSRASLKCWSLDVDSILNNDVSGKSCELDVSLNSSCRLLAELRTLSPKSRKKKRFDSNVFEDFTCDIRFMSLSVFSLTGILRSVWTDTDVFSSVGVIAGCSDGYLRFYVFDHELKTFTLIGQGAWNERCVLCVGHFFHSVSTQLKLVVYASDTAGFIGFWDVTKLYIEHFCLLNKSIIEEGILNDEYCSLDAKKEDCVLDIDDLEIDRDFKLVNSFGFQNCSADDLSNFKSKKAITRPFYSHKLHQSGVNSISLMLKDNDKYLLCSGGDDGAVTFASFKVYGMNDINVDICSWSMIAVPDAHIAAVTGVKLLEENFAVSASVDQRLKLWKINWSEEKTTASLINSSWLDVVDIQDIDVDHDRNGLFHIAASGVGLQMFAIKSV